jgi:hypothetical protein
LTAEPLTTRLPAAVTEASPVAAIKASRLPRTRSHRRTSYRRCSG